MNLNPNSHLIMHMQNEHKELDLTEEGDRMAQKFFMIELVGQHRTAIDRQLAEALAIAKAGAELEKGADSADTSVLFFSEAVLIFRLCTHKNIKFSQNWHTCIQIC